MQCNKCSDCCGMLPLHNDLLEKHKDKFQTEIVKKMPLKDKTLLFTKDHKCIFLDRKKDRCLIYEDRPQVCRDFGTGIDSETGKESVLMFCHKSLES